MEENNQTPSNSPPAQNTFPNQPTNQPSPTNETNSMGIMSPEAPSPQVPQQSSPSQAPETAPESPNAQSSQPTPQPKIQEEPLTTAPLKKKRNYLIFLLLILFLLLITISGLSIAIAYEKISFGNLPLENKIREVVLGLSFLKNFLSALGKSFEKVLQLFQAKN